MSGVTVAVQANEAIVALGNLKRDAGDNNALLNIAAVLMKASIARTFRGEGSPSGSWPRLAASTLKKKGYSSGHKLLIMSGRLFGSFDYTIQGSTLVIGTSVRYAAVHQFGSHTGAAGKVKVKAYDYLRLKGGPGLGKMQIRDKNNRLRNVRMKKAGPRNASKVHVGEHTSHQNIPARPFLVIRPEDPARIVTAFESYFRGNKVSVGRIG